MTEMGNNAPNDAEKAVRRKVVGVPFRKGNPSRPKGSRHKTKLGIQALLDGERETLTRKAIDMALAGDTTALRLCLERLAPPRKDAPV